MGSMFNPPKPPKMPDPVPLPVVDDVAIARQKQIAEAKRSRSGRTGTILTGGLGGGGGMAQTSKTTLG